MASPKLPIFIERTKVIPTFERKFEIVERKGIGHPDTICDLVMDEISIELSKMYLKKTGSIQHHNLDKALLVAGQTENRFGGGKVTKPMKLVIGDRATFTPTFPRSKIEEIAIKTANSWFKNNLRFIKKNNIKYHFELGSASPQLQSIFKDREEIRSNDTSALVGYAPLTKTETAVLDTERYLNSKKFKSEFQESGEDIKVMGFRNENQLDLTVAMAFVDLYVNSEDHYFKRKSEMVQALTEFHRNKGYFDHVNLVINNLDRKGVGMRGLYLTVLGTSADCSDSGQVGRGNRANQLISLNRPAGSEATAGKNSVSHIGKIYSIMCFNLAKAIYENVTGMDEVYVWMYNLIGNPVDKPKAVIVQPVAKQKIKVEASEINKIIEEKLAKMDDFCKQLMSGKIKVA
jgi:S-adenosylmethionine synthetase